MTDQTTAEILYESELASLRAELVENRELRSKLQKAEEWERSSANMEEKLRSELAAAKEEIERLKAQAGESVGVLRGRDGNVSMQVIYDHAIRYWTEAQRDHLRRRLSSTAQLEAEARVLEYEMFVLNLDDETSEDQIRFHIGEKARAILAVHQSEPAKAEGGAE